MPQKSLPQIHDEERKAKKRQDAIWLAVKVAVGSSVAIYIAKFIDLEYASAAGGVALLTIMGTKWETVKLSLLRLLTFALSVVVMWAAMSAFHSQMAAYGIFVFFLVLICGLLGWESAISVNAVIATHFMAEQDFVRDYILNEFLIVVIGVAVAIVVNLFHPYHTSKKDLIRHMRHAENELQMILGEMAAYLSGKDMQVNVWERITRLEQDISDYIVDANEYQNNTFHSHPGYYIDYFEMRLKQCVVLHNLHDEMRKIRKIPTVQSRIVADYILYMDDYVVEINLPEKQMTRLYEVFDELRQQSRPESPEEFENQAIVFHILLGLEDFLNHKKRFVEQMCETQKEIYWMKTVQEE
jgi:uncharacterized membrane protein YgaE (UPF0421/DUF939 family)